MACLHGLPPVMCAICNRACMDRPEGFKGARAGLEMGLELPRNSDLSLKLAASRSDRSPLDGSKWMADNFLRDVQALAIKLRAKHGV